MSEPNAAAIDTEGYAVPHVSLGRLFLRFLRFGALAWGGPVAQIGMLRQELVEQERWVSPAEFNRALAVYQALPGPEAHELCVYFGQRARGRKGGVLAGLGFMLPGFVLMFALSWLYVEQDVRVAGLAGVLGAVQIAVAALIVRAVVRIGAHVITDRWLWGIALLASAAQLAGVHFGLVVAIAGAIYFAATSGLRVFGWVLVALAAGGIAWQITSHGGLAGLDALSMPLADLDQQVRVVSIPMLFWFGLKAGLLTFGGAYTAIPFVQRDAVVNGGWMSNGQFLDGLALSGLLPAPLVIFATFVGYLGGGPWGAVAMTAGMFLPAFAFTLLGHAALERLLQRPRVNRFLEGVTAGVVGLIVGTILALMKVSLTSPGALALFCVALAILFATRAKLAVPGLILAAALWGALWPT